MSKISIIGAAGNIGSTLAFAIVEKNLCSTLSMVDLSHNVCKGKSLDIGQAACLFGSGVKIEASSDYKIISGSDIIVITAGLPRKPGMTREDLIESNAKIIKEISGKVVEYAPDAIVIIVTNPLDIMTHLFYKLSGFSSKRVIGMAGVLDSARFKFFLSKELNISFRDIKTMILGGHSDTMVPLKSCTSISGIPLNKFIQNGLLTDEVFSHIVEKTRNGGVEIVKYLGNGSAFYLPATSILEMISSIIFDENRLLNCCTLSNGEFGVKNISIGMPVILGKKGVISIVDFEIDEDEKSMIESSALSIKTAIETIL